MADAPRVTVVRKPVRGSEKKDPARATEPDPCIRAANEDDDGYDPYSDRREATPLFEPDPWN